MLGRNCRVFLGDQELHYVRHVEIEAPLDGCVTTRLELICGVRFENGDFYLEGGPALGGQGLPVQDGETLLKVRAISLDNVPCEPST